MSRVISPYDRQDALLESGSGLMVAILITAALCVSLVLHALVLWVFLFLLSGPPSTKKAPEDFIIVQLLGDTMPAAPAAPAAPVDPDLKGPDVVEASQSDPVQNQPAMEPPSDTILPPTSEVIPLGRPKVPDKPPQITKKAPPPEVKAPPKVIEKKDPPKKTEAAPNPDAELNKTLAELRRKVEAEQQEAQNASHYNTAISRGEGSGEGSQDSGSTAGVRLDPERERYYRHVRDIVRNNFSWTSPSGTDESKLVTTVDVPVQVDGSFKEIRVFKSSGNQDFDIAVARAINLSNPLPPLPPVFGGQAVTMRLQFKPGDLR